jgi:hypothetical protein
MIDFRHLLEFQLLSIAEGAKALRFSQAMREFARHCHKHDPLQPPWII